MRIRWIVAGLLMMAVAFTFVACESGGDNPYISINGPTSGSSWSQDCTAVTLWGEIDDAGYVHATNTTTGETVRGFVFYGDDGYWEARLTALVAGQNFIVVTADQDNTGRVTDNDVITITVTLP